MKLYLDPKILLAGAGVAILSLFPFDASFDIFLTTTLCLLSAYGAYYLNQKQHRLWILLTLLAIFYNPITPILNPENFFWPLFDLMAALIFLYVFRDQNPSQVTIRFFYYAGKIILVAGSCFTALLFIAALPYLDITRPQYFNPVSIIFIIASLMVTVSFTVFWNYLFLKKSYIWIPRLEEILIESFKDTRR